MTEIKNEKVVEDLHMVSGRLGGVRMILGKVRYTGNVLQYDKLVSDLGITLKEIVELEDVLDQLSYDIEMKGLGY